MVLTNFDYLVQCFSNFSGAQSPYNILALRESQTKGFTGLVNNPNTKKEQLGVGRPTK